MEPGTGMWHLSGVTPQKLKVAFRNVRFPADRNMLLSHARLSPVAESVVGAVEALPPRRFANIDEVCRYFGFTCT